MKKLIILLISLFVAVALIACEKSGSKKQQFGFGSSDCNQVQRNCMNQCAREGKPSSQCINECDKARSMCAAVKVKGCMQDCNQRYGKGTSSAESCKGRCKSAGGDAL